MTVLDGISRRPRADYNADPETGLERATQLVRVISGQRRRLPVLPLEIRPREDTSRPADFAQSRMAWTWSRLVGAGAAALPLALRLEGAGFAAFTGEAAFTNRSSFSRNIPALELDRSIS